MNPYYYCKTHNRHYKFQCFDCRNAARHAPAAVKQEQAVSARKLDLFRCAFVPDENYVSERSGPTVLYVRLNENVYRVENANDE